MTSGLMMRDLMMSGRGRVAAILLCAAAPAAAADLGSLEGLDIRLDTTLRASIGLRLDQPNPALLDGVNSDDGDRAFKRGLMSERVDFLSQLDASRGNFGLNFSVDGWYDLAYQTHDANHSSASFNPNSVPSDEFPTDVRRLMGSTIELGNAYVRENVELAGIPVTVRVGRQTLIWGESLFFPQDGIAGAQSPVDVIKQISQPLAEAREVLLPVGQADIRISLPYELSLEAYYQFEWRRDRTPGVSSYFSTTDILDAGGERAFIPGGGVLVRGKDRTPADIGQFGMALRRSGDAVDLGLYAIRYNAKEPQIAASYPGAPIYTAVFPGGIELLGVSASTYVGDDTLSGEISHKWHMPLVSRALPEVTSESEIVPAPGRDFSAGFATGQTLQALISYERQMPPGKLWDAASLRTEFALTDLLRVESEAMYRRAGTTRMATAIESVFSWQYFQVRPGLDVTTQIGAQVGLSGRSSVDPGMVAGTGGVTLSIAATYRTVWNAGVSWTHFVGPASNQPLADRDFIIFSLGRTF